jgi:ATP-dependent Clp endopeptidase proteolytic subunit ClpP
MNENHPRFHIFNRADKGATKAKWKDHFQNRSPEKPKGSPKLEVKASADGMSAEILIMDEIGYWGITAKAFATALAGITASTINVRISSPGGDVFDGLAIYNALKAHPATINTVVEGLAASAASFIMLAGDTVTMAENSMAMVHNAWGLGVGNASDMRALAGVLDKIDGQIAGMYAAKSGKTLADCQAAMAAETWFTASEAKDFGLIDSVISDDPGNDQETADDKAVAAKALKPRAACDTAMVAARAALAAYDPDTDGDDDTAEAVALITEALGKLTDAIEALTGTEDDDAAEMSSKTRVTQMRLRLALATHE